MTDSYARTRRIAEDAYYRALHRGFVGGDPVADWLAAEREIARTETALTTGEPPTAGVDDSSALARLLIDRASDQRG